jgi:hypothetical protein
LRTFSRKRIGLNRKTLTGNNLHTFDDRFGYGADNVKNVLLLLDMDQSIRCIVLSGNVLGLFGIRFVPAALVRMMGLIMGVDLQA